MNSANEFQPRVSPLPFAPSDNIVLSVSCEAAGKPSGTGCEVAVLTRRHARAAHRRGLTAQPNP